MTMLKPLNILFSHAYITESVEKCFSRNDGELRVLMDSGAFTAYEANRKGKLRQSVDENILDGSKLCLDTYCQRIERLSPFIWQYIALDVLWNYDETRANYEKMVLRGLKPMGVITVDADISCVRDYVKHNRHVCMAGGTSEPTNSFTARLEAAWRKSDKQALLHGLGYTRTALVRSRLYSADSSAWIQGRRYGNVGYLDLSKKAMRAYYYKNPIQRLKLLSLARKRYPNGYDGLKLTTGTFGALNIISIAEWLGYASMLREAGIELFFATTTISDLCCLMAVNNSYDPLTGAIDAPRMAKTRNALSEKGECYMFAKLLEEMNG